MGISAGSVLSSWVLGGSKEVPVPAVPNCVVGRCWQLCQHLKDVSSEEGQRILEGGSRIHNWGQWNEIEQNEVGYLDKLPKCLLDHLWGRVPEVPTDALLVESFKSISLGHHMLPIAAASRKQSQRLRKLGQEGLGEVILASRDEWFHLKHPPKDAFQTITRDTTPHGEKSYYFSHSKYQKIKNKGMTKVLTKSHRNYRVEVGILESKPCRVNAAPKEHSSLV